jgi:predicted kinase
MKSLRNLILEVIVEEEQLDEKLITYNNRKPYGQVVFLVGGAGSGKGFAGSKFLDSAGFKVRDVDELKKQLQILNRLGKITVKDILKKYGSNIKSNDLNLINKVFNTETPQGGQQTIRNLNLKNPDHVAVLHNLVKAMGIKEKSLENMFAAANNPETLPNIMFDITAKDLSDITEVLPQLKDVGYKAENVHLTWILTNYVIAMDQNKTRERMVPEDILLKTHEGAANTIWSLLTRALPKGMNGRVDVVLNNPDNTIYYKDVSGKDIEKDQDTVKTHIDLGDKDKTAVTRSVETKKTKFVAGFLSLPIKKAGGGIFPEKAWRDTLFQWIKDNAPDVITKNMK